MSLAVTVRVIHRPLTRAAGALCAVALVAHGAGMQAPRKLDASAPPPPPAAAPAPAAGTAAAPAQPANAAAPASAPAAAGDKPGDKPGDVPKGPIEKLDPKIFDEALNDFFIGHHETAARKLYAYLEQASPTDENYAWAQLFLGKSLLELGLRHAGAVYLARIARERSNPNALPRALEELHKLTDVPHDEAMIDEQVFAALDLGFLPEETAAYAHYQQGLMALKVGNERWALNHFSKLAEDTPQSSRAKFAVLVTRLKTAKEIPPTMIDEFLALSKDPKLNQETRNEAMLAVARLRYEKKDFEGALQAYQAVQLPPLDPGRATLYLEEAWTRYMLGQIHAAMGILTTLDSPDFRDEFLPDKYLLRAFIYRDLCQYLPAKRAAKELTRRYADSLEAIHNRDDLTRDLRLRRAAESHGNTQRARKFLDSLTLEGERINRYAGAFGDHLVAYLTKLYDLEHAEAQRVYEARLHEAVRQEADKLLRGAEQVRLMEYEVGLKLYERIKKGSKLVGPEKEPALGNHVVTFKFDGEYWNDELRDYRFSLNSRCIEESAQ